MSAELTINGTGEVEVVLHDDISSVLEELSKKPKRVFTFTSPVLFSYQSNVAFIDNKGVIHGYSASFSTEEQRNEVATPIWEKMDELKIKEVDGAIRLDKETQDIYQIFQTEDQSDDEKVMAQFENWLEAAKEVVSENPTTSYLQFIALDESNILVDLTNGKMHTVTVLVDRLGQTTDYLKVELPETRFQDNTNVIQWGKNLINK